MVMKLPRVCGVIATVALLLSPSACNFAGPPSTTAEVEQRFTRWREARPTAYSFELTQTCSCPDELQRPTAVQVAGNNIIAATDVATGDSLPTADPRALSIDDIFRFLIDHTKEQGASVNMQFDSSLHFPRHIHGWLPDFVGSEFSITVDAFEII